MEWEKSKVKHALTREPEIMPQWVLIAWCVLVLAVLGYSLPLLFDAYAWVNVYKPLGFTLMGLILLSTIGVLILGIRISTSAGFKFVLRILIVLAVATLLILQQVAIYFWWTFPCLGFLVFCTLAITFGVFANANFSYRCSLLVLGLSLYLGFFTIGFQLSLLSVYTVRESAIIDNKSYYYITEIAPAEPGQLKIYRCNTLGYDCIELLWSATSYQYTLSADYSWEVEEAEKRFTLFVDGNEKMEGVFR